MNQTPYHARYFAHELTKRPNSASIDGLTAALADAQVDLNPHQVEAALSAFRSPTADKRAARWSEDLKFGLEQEIKDFDKEIREAKRASTIAATLADKLMHQRALKALQTTRSQKRRDLFVAQDKVESRRDGLISDIESRLEQGQHIDPIFTIRWRLA
jgi:hypothetical protein